MSLQVRVVSHPINIFDLSVPTPARVTREQARSRDTTPTSRQQTLVANGPPVSSSASKREPSRYCVGSRIYPVHRSKAFCIARTPRHRPEQRGTRDRHEAMQRWTGTTNNNLSNLVTKPPPPDREGRKQTLNPQRASYAVVRAAWPRLRAKERVGMSTRPCTTMTTKPQDAVAPGTQACTN